MSEEKREKFIESAGKRVNNVIHDIEILEPMARSNIYDFSKEDVDQMFTAMQETLDSVKDSYYKKFEEKAKAEKKVFTFGTVNSVAIEDVKPIVMNNEENSQVENIL